MDSIVQCFIFLCLTTASFSTETGSGKNPAYGGDRVVSEGEPFQISCQVNIFDQVRWQKDGQTIHPDTSNNYTFEVKDIDAVKRVALLSVPSAHISHSGSYRCNSFSTQSHQFLVLGASEDDDKISYYYLGYKHSTPFNLQCKLKASNAFPVKWFKDDKEIDVKDLNNQGHYEVKEEEGDTIFVIKHPTEKDLGNYTCKLQDTNNNTIDDHVNHFRILTELNIRMEPSTTVVEGEELKIRCLVISKSPPHRIEWLVGNTTYDSSRDRVVLKPDEKNIANAIFIIEKAVMDDRGAYQCVAFATPNSSEDSKDRKVVETYVRVKDKLAALWPFLGICAEVFVLCAIILIYEKKRNQAELEESDTDQSPDQKNTSEHGKDTVRQRK